MKSDHQLDLRTAYADRRRKKSFKETRRVLWKTKSRLVA